MDARDIIIRGIFYNPAVLTLILQDQAVGVSTITKILTSGCASTEERTKLIKLTRAQVDKLKVESSPSYKKLFDELNHYSPKLKLDKHDPIKDYVFPTRSVVPTEKEPLPPLYPKELPPHLPTPNQSPQYYSSYNPYYQYYYPPGYGHQYYDGNGQ